MANVTKRNVVLLGVLLMMVVAAPAERGGAHHDQPAGSAQRHQRPAALVDGKTSPQWAVYGASTLQNSTTVVIPGAGDGALFLIGLLDKKSGKKAMKCAQNVVASFLSNPMEPDTKCVAKLEPAAFTSSASELPPDEVMEELNNLSLFDEPF